MKNNNDSLQFVDTHCHIHDSEFYEKFQSTPEELLEESRDTVRMFICVGTDVKSSEEAVGLAYAQPDCYATVALHPHEAEKYSETELKSQVADLQKLLESDEKHRIKAIGECGLDYFYHQSEKVIKKQEYLFRLHIDLALKYDLPLVFHIRDAFDDFFRIIDQYKAIRGVVHSFTANKDIMEQVVSRGLFIGLNGIMTFTKDESQLAAAKAVPLKNLVLETDAPFLTPKPFRGKMCKPKHVRQTAEFLSELRGESLSEIAFQTMNNAHNVFGKLKE